MASWNSIFSFFTGAGSRNKGLQSGTPGHYGTSAATPVSLDSAMQLSSVWACVKLLTESIGSMPINMYKVKDNVRTLETEHPLAILLRGKVNRWQTRQEFMESILYQYFLQGNCYAARQYAGEDENKRLIALVPLMSPQMEVELMQSGEVIYRYTDTTGVRVYSSDSIWHNKMYGNGIVGLSPIGYARNTIAVGQAAEQAVTKVYSNGGKPSGLLMLDKTLKPEQRAQIKQNFAELSEGNQDRLFVLEANMKYEQVSLSPQDIELLASRRFQLEEICRFFGVPSVLVNDTTSTTVWGSGISQILQGFYKFGLRPTLERLESSILCNLLDIKERPFYEFEFDFSALLTPDYNERLKAGKEGVTGGLITSNEWRKSEGMQALPGGDSLYMQQQMAPMEQLKDMDRSKTQQPTGQTDEKQNQNA